ncbi:MAG TPA: cysteine desulfurase-like protein [Candidatus Eisenbacteria bacterium]|nr:cysteine desulfurase-like protein [Candidatus Eisenbacteria bacterium]
MSVSRGAGAEAGVASEPAFPVTSVRSRFPALRDAGDREVFLDNAAGAQVPDEVLEAVRGHLLKRNVQRGGRYRISREVDAQIAETRRLIALFLNAASPEEIVFGLNATSLIRSIADAARPLFKPGDRVVVTNLDHESNIGPWLRLEREGVTPVFWNVRGTEARLDLDDLRAIVADGAGPVRLIAMPLASNAIGRIADVAGASRIARECGAQLFVDAVHFAPHGPIDVQALGADFLAFSAYKIFGPHIGFLWGRAESLRRLAPAREFFIPDQAPYAFEGGTQSYEGIAGMAGALRYLASVGDSDAASASAAARASAAAPDQLLKPLRRGMERIRAYEMSLASALLRELRTMSGITILGDADPEQVEARVPTFAFSIAGRTPREIVERLSERSIHARDGNMYAPRLLQAAGFDPEPGVTRVSLCHYNTLAEIARFGEALRTLAA